MRSAVVSANATALADVAPALPARARDHRSDELKAAAIIGVVIIHTGWPFAEAFRYCVPVFVAIWAFHYEQGLARRGPDGVWPYAVQRFIRLAIPYLFWTLLYLLLFHSLAEWTTTPIHTIVGGWFGGYGWAGQYFFIILFQLTWLFPLLRRFVTPSSVWIVLAAGTLLNAGAVYFLFQNRIAAAVGDRLFLYWLLYLFLGVAFARGFPTPLPWLLLGAGLLLAAPAEMNALKAVQEGTTPYLLPSVTLGTAALLLAIGPRANHGASENRQTGFWTALRYIGRHSFVIFVAHILILEGARAAGLVFDTSLPGFLGRATLICIAIAGSLVLGWLLQKLRLSILIGG